MEDMEAEGSEAVTTEPAASGQEGLISELKELLLPKGTYRAMSVEARNAAVDAIMAKLKSEEN